MIRPVLRSGLPLRAAVRVALVADTLSITVVEVVVEDAREDHGDHARGRSEG